MINYEKMEQIFALMAFLGGFIFISMGLCVANSIEAKESKIVSNIMTFISILGMVSFLVGFFGLLLFEFFL